MTIGRTEARHEQSAGIHALPPETVLARLLEGQRFAAARVTPALPALAAAAEAVAAALDSGRRVAYAGAFRSFGRIVIIEHEDGWATLITGLGRLGVSTGDELIQGSPIGVAGSNDPRITVELRHGGRPVDILPLVARG